MKIHFLSVALASCELCMLAHAGRSRDGADVSSSGSSSKLGSKSSSSTKASKSSGSKASKSRNGKRTADTETDEPLPLHPTGTHNHRRQDRIIGGSEAVEDRFSFAVSLSDGIGHFCGGSMITKDCVLTAAHCQGAPYDVIIRRHDLNDNDGERIPLREEVPHPGYDSSSTNNDFMLVFLEEPTTENVDLISLNTKSDEPDTGGDVTVIGWGDTDIRDDVAEQSDVLMQVQVRVISNEECDESEGEINGREDDYHDQITENMLCAKANRQDSCQGDSGGPLIVKGSGSGDDVQVGVVSWGIGCASKDFPGVYARVSRAYDWIEREVCEGSRYASEAGFDCAASSARPNSVPEDNDDAPKLTRRPTRQPTRQPRRKPRRKPTREPTRRPSGSVTPRPSRKPNSTQNFSPDNCFWWCDHLKVKES